MFFQVIFNICNVLCLYISISFVFKRIYIVLSPTPHPSINLSNKRWGLWNGTHPKEVGGSFRNWELTSFFPLHEKLTFYYARLLLVRQPSYLMKYPHCFYLLLIYCYLYIKSIVLRCLRKQIGQALSQRQFKSFCRHSKTIWSNEIGDLAEFFTNLNTTSARYPGDPRHKSKSKILQVKWSPL